MNALIENINKLHTTELGAERIKRNLQIETGDVVQWCKTRIPDKNTAIEKTGKNWYATIGHCKITVNAHSYTIITAHKVNEDGSIQKHAKCSTETAAAFTDVKK